MERRKKIIKNAKRLLAILRHFAFAILVGTLIFVTTYKALHKGELIKFNGIGILIVVSGSMEPTIESKEMIIIKEQNEYNKGDIITYKDENDTFITHRIVDINDRTFKNTG